MRSPARLDERKVLLEFMPVGNVMRVSAIDPDTNTEVVIQGPLSAGRESLSRTAIAKLKYVLGKAQAAPPRR